MEGWCLRIGSGACVPSREQGVDGRRRFDVTGERSICIEARLTSVLLAQGQSEPGHLREPLLWSRKRKSQLYVTIRSFVLSARRSCWGHGR